MGMLQPRRNFLRHFDHGFDGHEAALRAIT
jgi:hypothetical protein